MTRGTGAGAVIPTVIQSHDRAAGLTHLSFRGGTLKVPFMDRAIGDPIRVRVRPRDIAIALECSEQISVQNIFKGTIEHMSADGDSLVDVRVDIGPPLLAKITSKARVDLGPQPGQQVFALIKSVSISFGTRTENRE